MVVMIRQLSVHLAAPHKARLITRRHVEQQRVGVRCLGGGGNAVLLREVGRDDGQDKRAAGTRCQ